MRSQDLQECRTFGEGGGGQEAGTGLLRLSVFQQGGAFRVEVAMEFKGNRPR